MEFLDFWAKARPPAGEPGPSWHPIAYHLLDVAAVMTELLEARPTALRKAGRLLGIEAAEARQLLVVLAALHDVGKFAPAFQIKAPERWSWLAQSYGLSAPIPGRHTEDGYALWSAELADELGDRIWKGGTPVIERLAPAVFGHHGKPVPLSPRRAKQGFPPPALAAARACAATVVDLLCPQPIGAQLPRNGNVDLASWHIAGLMTAADWIGSSVTWFSYRAPLADDPSLARYWNDFARPAARLAVRGSGMVAPAPAPPRNFRDLTQLDADPTPLQQWAERVALPRSPCLVLIEDVTGAGKTEAAQLLVHRLMSSGSAAGAYWGMPTQATANAMYARQANMLARLFAEGSQPGPSMVLAHGQQKLHEAFQNTVLRGASTGARSIEPDDEVAGSATCAAFLADDRRAALLADVGAGTIDQALLSILPSRFNTVRLLGMTDKVLVVDEAHAYDAYMNAELQALLAFQAALGGYAVVLSATLSARQRRQFASAWIRGLLLGGWGSAAAPDGLKMASDAYPLATVVSADGVQETALETAVWSHRRVSVRWVHDRDDALSHAREMAANGAAVVWIRNTVDDCLAAAADLRSSGLDRVMVFHARFAQSDRQRREREIMDCFGKSASQDQRAGWILVATQVVEQSLDLDFDVMISDLAPVDLLIQRAGRLWRHAHRDAVRPQACRREMVVLSPRRDPDPPRDWLAGIFSGTAAVYQNAGDLWRTVEVLDADPCIDTPGGLRALVEGVYGSEYVPDSLLMAAQRAAAKDLSSTSTARYGTLKAAHGYHANQPWVDDLRVPTRLGDVYATLRLARVNSDGTLAPWASATPDWRAWALSEVRVRQGRIPAELVPLPQFQLAAAQTRAGWGRFEQELPILPLEQRGDDVFEGELVHPRNGKHVKIRYTTADGLVFGDAP